VGGFTNNIYWSSSQNTAYLAYSLNFGSGSIITDNKNNGNHVRCIRSYTLTENLTYTYTNAIITNQPNTVTITAQPQSQNKCLNSNVTFSVSATGTTTISYLWKKDGTPITGATSNTYTINGLSLLDEGIYTCEATNLCRTDTSDNAELKVIDINVEAGSDTAICNGQSAQLQATGSSNHLPESDTLIYNWGPASGISNVNIANPVANPIISTTYTVTVTDTLGCTEIDSLHIVVGNVFQNEQICVASVDTTINENKIVWEKTPNVGTDTFYVYKKDLLGLYNIIGKVPYDSMSVFIDTSSAPNLHSDSYKISVVDTCLNESGESPYHKTMYLSVSQGAQIGQHNLTWEIYEGFTFNYYRIYRGLTTATLALIDSVITGTTTYSDTTIITGDVYYLIQIVKTDSCIATSNAKDQTEIYNTSVSNLEEYTGTGIEENQLLESSISIYPNPASGNIQVKSEKLKVKSLEIYDMQGKHIKSIEINSYKTSVDISALAKGMYFVKAKTENGVAVKKFVKE